MSEKILDYYLFFTGLTFLSVGCSVLFAGGILLGTIITIHGLSLLLMLIPLNFIVQDNFRKKLNKIKQNNTYYVIGKKDVQKIMSEINNN